MLRCLGTLLLALLLAGTTCAVVPADAREPLVRSAEPRWAAELPAGTTQVVRTVSSRTYCRQVWCTLTQAWERAADGGWTKVREYRSTIGLHGWGKRREGDGRSPGGVGSGSRSPSRPRRATRARCRGADARRPRSSRRARGRNYNTWLEVPGVTSGDRPSMRSGWVLDFNRVRLEPGVGPRPAPRRGSGIFFHTSKPGHRWAPTAGCTQVGTPHRCGGC